jgi:hypothetical protein
VATQTRRRVVNSSSDIRMLTIRDFGLSTLIVKLRRESKFWRFGAACVAG